MSSIVVLLLVISAASVLSDTPANCTYNDILGTWQFYEGARGQTGNTIKCTGVTLDQLNHVSTVSLQFPNKATDQFGNKGTWTLIYNQGFEVIIDSRKYFAFSNYTKTGQKTISLCHQTLPGWSHDVMSRDWACYIGKKLGSFTGKVENGNIESEDAKTKIYSPSPDFVKEINAKQSSWIATDYPQFHGKTFDHLIKMSGGPNSRNIGRPGRRTPTVAEVQMASTLPDNFDWRNVGGQNFVSPVRNQGGCGSCFAFASMAGLEARTRILTNNSQQPVFSPQDVLDCSFYQQGCLGGFPYLIEGKYAEDFGVVKEECNPYRGTTKNPPICDTTSSCRRYYATNYSYIGGYYGGCNEEAMRIELVKGGPIVVGFEVYNDFMNYQGGIYHHTGIVDKVNHLEKFSPFQIVNHAVLVVGYGVDAKSGEKYWIVKNSWGPNWGLNGYFKIRRGNDECGIESLAVKAMPIPTY